MPSAKNLPPNNAKNTDRRTDPWGPHADVAKGMRIRQVHASKTHHSRTFLSTEPVASSWPSGENATAVTQLVGPVRVLRWSPLVGFHSRTVLSFEPVASSWPSGRTPRQ